MWRLIRRGPIRLFGRRLILSTNASSPSVSAFTAAPTHDDTEMEAHPILFDVPAMDRALGRDEELLSLWQSLLSGHRVQAITGPDGIGKSTLAAEFCERARRSGRFTCVRWLRGGDDEALRTALVELVRDMRGRRERDVLLVLDDAPDPLAALARLPDHPQLYTLVTTAADLRAARALRVLCAGPLDPRAAAQFPRLPFAADDVDVAEVLRGLGHVPLLMHVACALVESEAVHPSALRRRLREVEAAAERDGALRVGRALDALLALALPPLASTHPQAGEVLAAMAHLDTEDISPAVVGALFGGDSDGAEDFVSRLSAFGLCAPRWDNTEAFALHPAVARQLRTANGLLKASDVLVSLWPRRMRGAGGAQRARELVRHTRALLRHADASQSVPSPSLQQSMDRSASFLALGEGRALAAAAALWMRVLRAHTVAGRRDAEAARVARECGRLLHFLRDERAAEVLRHALDTAIAAHGRQSPEAALVLGCYAPYVPASQSAIDMLRNAVAALEGRLASVDAVLGREEEQMLHETIFVLLMCEGQMRQELGEQTPQAIWDALLKVEERIQKLKEDSTRKERG